MTKARSARQRLDERIRDALGDERFDRLLTDLHEVVDVLGLQDDIDRRTVKPPTGTLS